MEDPYACPLAYDNSLSVEEVHLAPRRAPLLDAGLKRGKRDLVLLVAVLVKDVLDRRVGGDVARPLLVPAIKHNIKIAALLCYHSLIGSHNAAEEIVMCLCEMDPHLYSRRATLSQAAIQGVFLAWSAAEAGRVLKVGQQAAA